MSKTERKRCTGAFKAKVGLEALMGLKTVGQIAREYQVHPVQVTQWEGVIREHLPGLFESPQTVNQDSQELVAMMDWWSRYGREREMARLNTIGAEQNLAQKRPGARLKRAQERRGLERVKARTLRVAVRRRRRSQSNQKRGQG